MDLGIAGRKAIVCASSRGLGRACAEALAENGVEIVLNGRDEKALAETHAAIRNATSIDATVVVADVSTPEGQEKLIAACPHADILVNNNGGPPPKDYRQIDRAAMTAGLVSNMITPLELIQTLVPGMADRGFGRVVNITSASVKTPITGLDLSSGARAGLTAFLGGVARQVAEHGVTINQILPGMFDTARLRSGMERMAAMKGVSLEEIRELRVKEVPARRIGAPREFGQLCAFLCSVHAGYITGQNFLIDGGGFASNF